jgi:hypothetical protein
VPGEIRGGWYQFALRDAAARAGHYHNAAEADAYWGRVAREINAACDSGKIVADGPRSGFMPRWSARLNGPVVRAWQDAMRVAVQFSDFTTEVITIENTKEQEAFFRRVTHQVPASDWKPPTKITALRIKLANIYMASSAPAIVVALISAVVLGIGAIRGRRSLAECAIVLALMGGTAALTLLIAVVDITSFSAIHAMYLAPAAPLAWAAIVLAPAWAWRRT